MSQPADKPSSPRKLFIKTWGCQMNEYDSSRMADLLKDAQGLVPTEDPAEADVILLNTCSIREKAQEKVFSQLGEWRELKQKNPNLLIGVGGCVASQEGENIRKRAPYVDVVFGPQTLHRLPAMIEQVQTQQIPAIDISFPEIEKFDRLPEPSVDGPSAYVSIMEGCNKYCTFCVVPYTRGPEVSRPLDDVLAEVMGLVERGVREINFLGQNVNAYRGAKHDGGEADLAELIELTASIPQIGRIRFTTSHPVEFSERLIEVYGRVPKLVSHLHLPIQSGSDRILAAMKRGHTVLEYKSKVRKLRAIRPALSLSTDLIIGFPGETEADFEATMKLVAEMNYDVSFSFVYSARPGTPAADLADDTPEERKLQRLQLLQHRLNQQAQDYARKMVGTEQIILVERPATKNPDELCGRTENNRLVNFAGPKSLIGEFVTVRITQALTNSLRGELIDKVVAA
ncbi:MAG: tRNA (N6-isopentenyl adenosine(37)-C2)-methylthiotransferase MiaB [Pseudomonadota bacterium]